MSVCACVCVCVFVCVCVCVDDGNCLYLSVIVAFCNNNSLHELLAKLSLPPLDGSILDGSILLNRFKLVSEMRQCFIFFAQLSISLF